MCASSRTGIDDLSIPPLHGRIAVRNRPANEAEIATDELVGADALALVRFGLRAADDPRIRDTISVIDHLTRVELPQGPSGIATTRTATASMRMAGRSTAPAIGRAWPLLTGERAHYAMAANDMAQAERLRQTIEGCASEGGLLPEQVWDAPDIPERELFLGRPSGSAMPLVWAHAEYVKLLRSLRDGAVFDLPPQTVRRYQLDHPQPRCRDWRESWRRSRMPAGQILRVELDEPGTVRWSDDNWATVRDTRTLDCGLGIHAAELPTSTLPPDRTIAFTWQRADGRWRGANFTVAITARPSFA